MSLSRSRRRWVVILGLVLLALFLVRPGAMRLKSRITRSIGLALGHRVEVGEVHLRLLPRPGFDLDNLVVQDDPAFSAEPMLRSQEVAAALRLSALFRGRLEIARLSLTEPSLNLVRSESGHWNLESLLERAARTSVAPTSQGPAEARPRFPYIEADNGRINVKLGPEKKPYALTEADFSLWLASETEWGMRLEARPVRTDSNVTDTGVLKVSGAWQRASSLRQTPLRFDLQWDRAQLGQVTKLISGNDKGWRGAVKTSASFTGTPADLRVQVEASIQDFRRYDILAGEPLRLTAQCSARYSSAEQTLSAVACQSPAGGGVLTLGGSVAGLPAPRDYDLTLTVKKLPVQFLVELASHAKKDLPVDLAADGDLNASFKLHMAGEAGHSRLVVEGGGATSDFRLRSQVTETELELGTVPFAFSSGSKSENRKQQRAENGKVGPTETHLDLGPFPLALGRPAPAAVRGWFSRSGYELSVQGEAQVQRLLQVARTLGLRAPQPAADGTARLDLQVAGIWSGFAAPAVRGTAQLRSVRAELRGVNAPVEIAGATLSFAADEVRVQNLTASLGGTRWAGWLALPRHCGAAGACPVRFDLHADQIVTSEVSRLFKQSPRKRPWYRLLSPQTQEGPSVFASLRAKGRLTAGRVVIRGLAGSRVTADCELQGGKLRLSELRAELLGGRHRGKWQADFTGKTPAYSGSGALEHIALEQLADAMRDAWITGTATAAYRATASGRTSSELASSAEATLQFDVRDGLLPHIALTSATGPLRVRHFAGRMTLRDGKFEIREGKLEAPSGIYQVSGTASLNRSLDIRLLRNSSHGFSITGSLAEPCVAPLPGPETQAALKP